MAEKIMKPKAFTKEWFGYVWDYYKWHILVSVAVIILAVFTVFQITTTVKYDANINFVATVTLEDEVSDAISTKCAENSADLNKNGRVDISIKQLNFTPENRENTAMHKALLENLMALFADSEELVFVVDSYMLEKIQNIDYADDLFYPATEWKEENSVASGEYAVSLKDSAVMKGAEVNSEDMFVLVAKMDYEDGFKEEEKNAINIANYLAK